jgi:predicted permease
MRIVRRLLDLMRRSRLDREMDDEMRAHLEHETEQNIAHGMSPEEARCAARRAFGGIERIQEEERDARGLRWLEDTWRDVRHAARSLRKSPGFTAVAVMSLALGIGANTAIFSALNGVLLRSLPVRNPGDLRSINWIGRDPHFAGYNGPGTREGPDGLTIGTSFPYPTYRALRDGAVGFTDVFAFSSGKSVVALGPAGTSTTVAMLVSGNYFARYGANPWLGRTIVSEDDRPTAAPVVVITRRWWERACASDPSVIGRTIRINQTSFTVIGVLPPNHVSPMAGDTVDLYVPLSTQPHIWPSQALDASDLWWLQLMGRLAPEANEAQAEAGLSVVFRQALGLSQASMEDGGIVLEDGSRGQLILRRHLARPFMTLAAIAGVVLLIACANLAGLLLARGAVRRHEWAVRAALGAGRGRLIRQSLVESFLLAGTGAVLGLFVAAWSRPLLFGVLEWQNAGARYDLSPDVRVLLSTAGISIATALIFGILPALRSARVDPGHALKSRTVIGTPRLNLGKALVVLQVALSVLLVVGAGLLIRTFANLARVAPGFDPASILLFRIRASDAGYAEDKTAEVLERIRATLAALPGAQAVTFSNFPLVSGSSSSDTIEVGEGEGASSVRQLTQHLQVGDDFLQTMRIPLVLGRDFSRTDTATSPPVVVINEAFARRYFPTENPIGRSFFLHRPTRHAVQIVGVVRDVKYKMMRADIQPLMFLPQRQQPLHAAHFALRSSLPPMSLLPAVRQAVAAIDPALPLSSIRTQQDVLDQSIAQERTFALLGGALAFLAVLLSCIGLYGLIAYHVARRTPEFGLRMALGARTQDVAQAVLREAALLVVAGLAIGVPTALGLVHFIASRLYGVAPTDASTFAAGALLFLGVALIAAWLPSRRAAGVDPMISLRAE